MVGVLLVEVCGSTMCKSLSLKRTTVRQLNVLITQYAVILFRRYIEMSTIRTFRTNATQKRFSHGAIANPTQLYYFHHAKFQNQMKRL